MSLCPLPKLSGAGPTACHIAEKEPGHSEQAASPVSSAGTPSKELWTI